MPASAKGYEFMRVFRHHINRVPVEILPLVLVFYAMGCATIDSLERGKSGRVHEAAYEDVYQIALAALEESGLVVQKDDYEKGTILAQSGSYTTGGFLCSGNLVGIFLERVGSGKTKVDIQEKLVLATQKLGCQDKSPQVVSRLTKMLRERAPTVARQQSVRVGPPEPSVAVSDVDDVREVKAVPKRSAYAVVIGIDQYREKLPRADFAAHDAEIVGQYLTKVAGYPEENVVVLLNDRATRTDVEKYIESWLPNRVEKDSTVFVYFSGHGAPNPTTGDAYLVPYDGDPSFVDRTGYPLKRLYESLGKLPTKETVVMLDSCFSGAGGRSVIAQGMRPMVLSVENPVLASGKTVVLAASSGAQVSSTYQQKSHGLLTYFFLKGLQGEADQNKDGSIDLAELYDYIKPQVSRVARREYNNDQTPQLVGSPEMLKKGVRLLERVNP